MARLLILLWLAPAFAVPCPKGQACLWKCCPPMTVLSKECIPGNVSIHVPKGIKVIYGRPSCHLVKLEKGENYTLNYNGTVTIDGEEMESCLDSDGSNETNTYVCPQEIDEDTYVNTFQLYSFGLFVSIPFLLATFLVYVCFKRSKLPDLYVIFQTFCMLLTYLFLALAQNDVFQKESLCVSTGYAIQFFFMATFFWLNVMCFDIYWAFSGLRNLTGSVKERERKKLILYSCYAWGVPLFILFLTIGMDYSPYVPNDSIFKPSVGVDKCFFQKDEATGIYFYMPMGFVLFINIILFSITAFRICTLRRETAVLKRGDSRKHDSTNDKERFSLYLKLFLVMGINWVMELVSFLAGGPGYIWYIPDFTNTLQGVFIFIIFVWKERVRRLVWTKLTSCCGCKIVSNPSRNQWTTSTRNTSSLTNSSAITGNSMKMAPMPLNESNGLSNGTNNGISNGISNGTNYNAKNDRNEVDNGVSPQAIP